MLLHKGQSKLAPVAHGLKISTSTIGQVIPVCYGTAKGSARLIYTGNFQVHHQSQGLSGGSGGSGGTSNTYSVNADWLLAFNLETVGTIWENNLRYIGQVSSQTFVGAGPATDFPFIVSALNFTGSFTGILAVLLEVSYAQSYTDYGGHGTVAESGTSLLPLYNGNFPFPNNGHIANAGVPYYTGNTVIGDRTIHVIFPAPVSGITVHVIFYQANTNASNLTPFTGFHLEFEKQLGSGSSGQPTVYPELSGVAAANFDLGPVNILPNFNFEMKGLFALGPDGDCNPADIIADIICSGNNPDLGSNVCSVRGLNLNRFPHVILNADNITYSRFGGILADEPDLWNSGGGTNLGLNAVRAYCQAYGIWASDVLEAQQSVAQLLDPDNGLCAVANCAPVWDGAVLKFIPYCEISHYGSGISYVAPTAAGPLFALDDSHFYVPEGQPQAPLVLVNERPQQNFNSLPVEYIDRKAGQGPGGIPPRGNFYNNNAVTVSDSTDIQQQGPMPGSPTSLHWIKDPQVALSVGWALLRRNLLISGRPVTFKLPAAWGLLTPMDLLTVYDPTIRVTPIPVRIKSVKEDEEFKLDVEAELFIYGASAPLAPGLTAQTVTNPSTDNNSDPGPVNAPIIFEAIPAISTSPQLFMGISGAGQFYGGCVVWLSTDGGSTYGPVGTVVGRQVTGAVYSANFASHTDPDAVDTLNVDLAESLGALSSFTAAQRDAFQSLCYLAGGGTVVVNGATLTIPYELIAYATANLAAANKYSIPGATTSIRRGVYGTPVATHNIGADFSFLKDGLLFALNIDPKWVGTTLHFKFTAFNSFGHAQEDLANVTDYPFAVTGLVGWSYSSTAGNPPPNTVPFPTGNPNPSSPPANDLYLSDVRNVAYTATETLLDIIPSRITNIPAGLAATTSTCLSAPAGAIQVSLKKNGTQFAAINFGAGSVTPTFTMATATSFNGTTDRFTAIAPVTPDATFAGLIFAIWATRFN